MRRAVDFYGLDGEESVLRGRVIWDGNNFSTEGAVPPGVIEQPVISYRDVEWIYPDDPEKFLNTLPEKYRSTYYWAEGPYDL